MATHDITLTVNDAEEELTVESRTLLVHALRDQLGYTGAKVGCETGKCGACTVALDGDAVKSCTVLAVKADGSDVTTVEGLADDGLHPIQESFHEEHGLQCGYCTPGMVMTTRELLDEEPGPDAGVDSDSDSDSDSDLDAEEIRHALKGNVCRCTGYQNVVNAVQSAAGKLGDGETTADSEAAAAKPDGGEQPRTPDDAGGPR